MERRYLKYGLKFNPFPATGDSSVFAQNVLKESIPFAQISVQKAALERIENLVRSADKSVPTFIIVGDWGTGKTHMLLYCVKLLQKHHEDLRTLPVYIIVRPEYDITSREDILRLMYDELMKSLKLHYEDLHKSISFNRDVISIISTLTRREFIVYFMFDQFEHCVKNLIERFVETKGQAKGAELDAAKKILDMIELICREFSATFGHSVVLGFGIYQHQGALLIRAMEERTMGSGALPIEPIELHYLRDLDDAKTLLKEYLNYARLTEKEAISCGLKWEEYLSLESKMRKSEGLYPFNEESVKLLFVASKGIPRLMVKYAYQALEITASKRLDEVTKEILFEVTAQSSTDHVYIKAYHRTLSQKFGLNFVLLASVKRILAKACELGLITVLPERLERPEMYGFKANVKLNLPRNVIVVLRKDNTATIMYVCQKVKREVLHEDVDKLTDTIHNVKDKLQNLGLRVNKVIFVTLSELSTGASYRLSLFSNRVVPVEIVKIENEPWDLGKILCLGDPQYLKEIEGRSTSLTDLIVDLLKRFKLS